MSSLHAITVSIVASSLLVIGNAWWRHCRHRGGRFSSLSTRLVTTSTTTTTATTGSNSSNSSGSGGGGGSEGDGGDTGSTTTRIVVVEDAVLLRNRRMLVIDNPDACEAALSLLLGGTVVGLDAEWVARGSNPVALLQLATTDVVLLLRVHMWTALPPVLCALLEDARIAKIGVGIAQDAVRILERFGVTLRGCLDLNDVAALSRYPIPGGSGLKTFALRLLGLALDKRDEIRCSDWEAPVLSPAQLSYAGTMSPSDNRRTFRVRRSLSQFVPSLPFRCFWFLRV